MFAKLLKNEWRNCRQVLGVLCAVTLGSGLTIGLSCVWLTWTEGRKSYLLAILLLFLAALAIGICAAGGFFYLIWRFYQSRFTDEGYLTFTLPVTNHQQLLAALVNIFRGTFLVFLATLGAFALMGLCCVLVFLPGNVVWEDLFQAVREYLPVFLAGFNWVGCLEVLALSLVGFAALVVKLLLCVTAGAILARKHKLFTAAAIYLGIGFFQSWGMFSLSLVNEPRHPLVFYSFGANLLIAVLGYLLTHWLTKRNLNLT